MNGASLNRPEPLGGRISPRADLRGLAREAAQRVGAILRDHSAIRGYAHLLGGSAARLVLSLVYFVSLTSALKIAEFGFFATSAAVGLVLSRLVAFGYGANLFVIAATRARLLGPYLGNFLVWLVLSLPLCLVAALAVHWAFFEGAGKLGPYLVIVAVEVIVWRLLDVVAAINSGLGRFGFSAATYNLGFLARTLAALGFLLVGDHSIGQWALVYAAANTAAFAVAAVFLMPRVRIRVRRGSLFLRSRNGLELGSAHLVSMAQGESDKVLILAFGGELAAGIFATCTRLIDITALPVRAFNIMMIQKVLRDPTAMRGRRGLMLTEAGIALLSTAAFAAIAFALWLRPDILGHEIAKAASVLPLLFLLPACRNLIEYQAELLYARQRRTSLLLISLVLILVKSAIMVAIFAELGAGLHWALAMNIVFLAAYLASTYGTYRFDRGPPAAPER
jgi:O-antigen/teichoic acid export membrane protein